MLGYFNLKTVLILPVHVSLQLEKLQSCLLTFLKLESQLSHGCCPSSERPAVHLLGLYSESVRAHWQLKAVFAFIYAYNYGLRSLFSCFSC